MQGVIHDCLKWIFENKLTVEQWEKMLEVSHADGYADFMNMENYDDELTMVLIQASAQVLGITLSEVLEIYGKYFFHYAEAKGYGKMLRHLGRDMESFLQNLDFHHLFLTSYIYGSIKAPSFRVEKISNSLLRLFYYSKRKGLYPLAIDPFVSPERRRTAINKLQLLIGLVKECGKEIYGCDLRLEVVDSIVEDLRDEFGFIRYQVVIDIFDETPNMENGYNIRFAAKKLKIVEDENIEDGMVSFLQQDLIALHPFHIVFNRDLRITSTGAFLRRHLPFIRNGDLVSVRFKITHPGGLRWDIGDIVKYGNMHVFLAVQKPLAYATTMDLEIKGVLRITTPIVYTRYADILSISDMSVFDVTRELTLLNQQRTVDFELSKELESTTVQLHQVSKDLASEKKRIQEILEEMLPKQVAEDLKMGRPVEAKSFDEASILFSDIVSFTIISSRTQPASIVIMLNDLFTRFDDLCAIHGVYKVETIGDAYMLAGGVPTVDKSHAIKVAKQACAMMQECGKVTEPDSNNPLRIRIGIHSGTIMAGVVGRKMPRYCLFGDTVNTASRMESHGVPERIHVSQSFKNALGPCAQFDVVERGATQIKGKGQMKTYFLSLNSAILSESTGKHPSLSVTHRPRIAQPSFSIFPTLAGKIKSGICAIS